MLKPADETYTDYMPIEPSDIDHLLEQMEVGKPYTFTDVYVEYCALAEAEMRTPAHFVPFSKAIASRPGVYRSRPTLTVDGKRKQVRVLVRRS